MGAIGGWPIARWAKAIDYPVEVGLRFVITNGL
jgi:hypothetical protein